MTPADSPSAPRIFDGAHLRFYAQGFRRLSGGTTTDSVGPECSSGAPSPENHASVAKNRRCALFDSHAHFGHLATAADRDGVVARAAAAGVVRILAVGGSTAENEAALELATRHADRVRAAVGWDRSEAAREPDIGTIREWLRHPGVAAVGETGLDYHYDRDSAPAQRALFEAMLGLAREARLPVVVHTREADDDTLALLSAHAANGSGPADRIGVMHCFTGTWPFARRLLDLGFHLSFSGIATFPNAAAIRDVAARTPADRLLVETDSPYLAPVPFRGRQNEPAFLPAVLAAIASARGEPSTDTAEITRRNAERLFTPPAEQPNLSFGENPASVAGEMEKTHGLGKKHG